MLSFGIISKLKGVINTKKVLMLGLIILVVCSIGISIAAQVPSSDSVQNDDQYTSDFTSINTNETIKSIENLLITGEIDRPPGVVDKIDDGSPTLKPTPPLAIRPDMLLNTNFSDNLLLSPGDISAGYQVFGGDGKPSYCGRVYGRTNSASNLLDQAKEWHVIHQWGRYSDGTGTENCVVITRSGSTATCGIYISSLGGYNDWVSYPANDVISVGIRPEHSSGSRQYNQVLVWAWDVTSDQWWSKTYTLPTSELIYSVDSALEQGTEDAANSLWVDFYNYCAFDANINNVNLRNNFGWLEWSFPQMYNEHSESYYNTYGTDTEATLWQRKTPK